MRFATLICIELEADGRRLRLARNPGEFFLLSCFVARFHELYRSARRRSGFTARLVSDQALAALSAQRRARERRRRERTGHYFPSRIAVRVPGEAGTDDTFVPLSELLGAEHIDPDGVVPPARFAAGRTAPPRWARRSGRIAGRSELSPRDAHGNTKGGLPR